MVLALLAFAGLAGFGPGQALANHVACGEVIAKDTVLDSDMVCSRDAIIIGASGITLDLNGHSITASGTVFHGVLDAGSGRGVTIENGSIRGFVVGVEITVSERNTVRDLNVSDALTGIDLFRSARNVIEHNNVSDTFSGINICCALDTGFFAGGNQVVANTVSRASFFGIHLDSDSNLAEGNVVVDAGEGVRVSRSAENIVRRNTVLSSTGSRGGVGVLLLNGSFNNLVERNTVRGLGVAGVYLTRSASSNLISRNSLVGNADGIVVIGSLFRIVQGNRLFANNTARNRTDGVRVETYTRGTIIDSTSAKSNGDDGIEVDVPDATVTANAASQNGDLGIEAVSGVVDGGGNTAVGNGNPLQCLNVFCK